MNSAINTKYSIHVLVLLNIKYDYSRYVCIAVIIRLHSTVLPTVQC